MTAREQKLVKVFVPVLALVGLYLVYDRAIQRRGEFLVLAVALVHPDLDEVHLLRG